jgi:predicted DNA binding CopG/RHH family protein
MSDRAKPIDDLSDIPENLSDEEQIEFLETHGVSEEFLEKTEAVPEDERPHPRSRSITLRVDDFTLGRLKELAQRRNVGYQTLLKEFVVERLYEEEKREGILSAGLEAKESSTPTEEAARQVMEALVHSYKALVERGARGASAQKQSTQRTKESMDDYRDLMNSMLSYWQEGVQAAERDDEDDEKAAKSRKS